MTDKSVPRSAKNQMPAGIALMLASCIVPAIALAADSLRAAAEDAASCLELRDAGVRLACFDAAADQLAETLGSMDQGDRKAGTPPDVQDAPGVPVAAESSGDAAEQPPSWATAPQPQQRDDDEANMPKRFEATVVKITINNVGRHRFYTSDGATWEQTQIVDVIRPKNLPAVAEFRRRLTGSPTIKFDVSSRSYRVKRIK